MTDKTSINIIILNTYNEFYSIACITKNNSFFEKKYPISKNNKNYILFTIDYVLKKSKLIFSDINLITFGLGSVRTTGFRICISVIQGLTFYKKTPVLGISIFRALAQKLWRITNKKNIIVVIVNKKNRISWEEYEFNQNKNFLFLKDNKYDSNIQSLIYTLSISSKKFAISVSNFDIYVLLKCSLKKYNKIFYYKIFDICIKDIISISYYFFYKKKYCTSDKILSYYKII
ncbi:yeaZ [Wigglesworthia glossinidia endosymbiont of Glossina brevipalpis]|uniref:YeaZ protein n=1 Tax=Wigglesworthia glossinidia brevipalpis TaxID=36870 RepID=Q8D2I2_WIGBR|nr:yeaZ [Wigglesworthia glossinidia endosymbiont of Glossina brevipalpis]